MSENNKTHQLKLRAEKNRKRPKFKRENFFRLKRIQTSWRSAKGIDSKMRHKVNGKRKSPGSGYRGPKAVRGLHPTGKEIVLVSNINELEKVNSETQVAQIRSSVGSRKRFNLINFGEDNDIHIINPQVKIIDFDDTGALEEEFTEAEDDLELLEEENEE